MSVSTSFCVQFTYYPENRENIDINITTFFFHFDKWSQYKNKCKSQMGQDQVSGGVSVLCWLAAPVAMFYTNLQNLVIRSKSVNKSSSVISSQIGVISIEGVIVYGNVPECHVTFGRGILHNVWWDPHIDHKTSRGRFQTFHDISLSAELRWKSRCLWNKTFIRRASPGIHGMSCEIKTL